MIQRMRLILLLVVALTLSSCCSAGPIASSGGSPPDVRIYHTGNGGKVVCVGNICSDFSRPRCPKDDCN